MTIPYITPKQQEIIKLHYQYRFINTKQIQNFLRHKDKKTINMWLKDLREKHYLEWDYSTKFGENTKPAIYHTGINGIRYLKTQSDYSMDIIQKLYRDGKREEPFIQRCILIADACLNLIKKSTSTTDVTFSFETASDYTNENSRFHFLIETEIEPSLCFIKQKNSKKTYYLVDIFDINLPNYRIRKRLHNYYDFYQSGEWENNITKTFPILLFICPTKSVLIYAKRITQKLLEENQNPTDLHIRFATVNEIKEFGITGEIWEEAE